MRPAPASAVSATELDYYHDRFEAGGMTVHPSGRYVDYRNHDATLYRGDIVTGGMVSTDLPRGDGSGIYMEYLHVYSGGKFTLANNEGAILVDWERGTAAPLRVTLNGSPLDSKISAVGISADGRIGFVQGVADMGRGPGCTLLKVELETRGATVVSYGEIDDAEGHYCRWVEVSSASADGNVTAGQNVGSDVANPYGLVVIDHGVRRVISPSPRELSAIAVSSDGFRVRYIRFDEDFVSTYWVASGEITTEPLYGWPTADIDNLALSADSPAVLVETAHALVSSDTNERNDLYVFEEPDATPRLVPVPRDDAEPWQITSALAFSRSGEHVAFSVRSCSSGNPVVCPVMVTGALRWPSSAAVPPRWVGCEEQQCGDFNGDGRTRWAILGDSYISGEGLTDPATDVYGFRIGGYDQQTDTVLNHCHRTRASWAVRAATAVGAYGHELLFAACSGAETTHILQSSQYPESPNGIHGGRNQAAVLADFANAAPVDVVIVGIGGNDVKFGDQIQSCVTSFLSCDPSLEPELAHLHGKVSKALWSIRRATPGARVVVAGYPNPILPAGSNCGSLPGTVTVQEQRNIGKYLALINNAINQAARDTGSLFLAMSEVFNGEGICSGAGLMNGLSVGRDEYAGWDVGKFIRGSVLNIAQESFHPTDEGHEVIRERTASSLARLLAAPPPAPQSDDAGGPLRVSPSSSLFQRYFTDRVGTTAQYYADRNEIVQIGSYSVPTVIAELEVAAGSTVDLAPFLPGNLSPGLHLLEAREKTTGVVRDTLSFWIQPNSHCSSASGASDDDGDGLTGDCDLDETDGPRADVDGDGMYNATDNCPLVPNSVQEDSDDNGIGDACQSSPSVNAARGFRSLLSDVAAPVVTAAISGVTRNGWHRVPPTITWSSTDPAPSSGPPTSVPSTIAKMEGLDVSYTSGASCDPSRRCSTTSASVSLDMSRPAIEASKFDNGTGRPVRITFTCSDNLSGVETCPEEVVVSNSGIGQQIEVAAMDRAGNTTSLTVSGIDVPSRGHGITRSGYWMVGEDGSVYAFGDAPHLGNAPVGASTAEDIEPTAGGGGYWVIDSLGHVFAYGDAPYLGGANDLRSSENVTAISGTPSSGGYWLFTTLGRVLPFGDAAHVGDMSATRLNAPVLDSVATPSGGGYYMVASDGGVFAFGDATFAGSMGGARLNAPVQSLVPDPDGGGYWLVASDGGIFAFDARFHGSMGDILLNLPVTGMVAAGSGGYLMVGEDGGIFTFGTAPFHGSLGHNPPARPVASVAMLAR